MESKGGTHAYKQVKQLVADFSSITKEQYMRRTCRIFGISVFPSLLPAP